MKDGILVLSEEFDLDWTYDPEHFKKIQSIHHIAPSVIRASSSFNLSHEKLFRNVLEKQKPKEKINSPVISILNKLHGTGYEKAHEKSILRSPIRPHKEEVKTHFQESDSDTTRRDLNQLTDK